MSLPMFKGIRPLNPLSLAIEIIILFGVAIVVFARWIKPDDTANTYLVICTGLLFYSIISTIMLILSIHMMRVWLLAFSCFIMTAFALHYIGNFTTGMDLFQIKPYARLIKVLSMSFVIFITIGAGIKQIADYTKRMK